MPAETNVTVDQIISIAKQLIDSEISDKEIIELWGWDNLIKIKAFKDWIELGYIIENIKEDLHDF